MRAEKSRRGEFAIEKSFRRGERAMHQVTGKLLKTPSSVTISRRKVEFGAWMATNAGSASVSRSGPKCAVDIRWGPTAVDVDKHF